MAEVIGVFGFLVGAIGVMLLTAGVRNAPIEK